MQLFGGHRLLLYRCKRLLPEHYSRQKGLHKADQLCPDSESDYTTMMFASPLTCGCRCTQGPVAVLSHRNRLLEGNLQARSALELTLLALCCEAVRKLRQLGEVDCGAAATALCSCSGCDAELTGADVEASISVAAGKYADRLCEACRIAGAVIGSPS